MIPKKNFAECDRNTVPVKLRLPWKIADKLRRCASSQETTMSDCVTQLIAGSTMALGKDQCEPKAKP